MIIEINHSTFPTIKFKDVEGYLHRGDGPAFFYCTKTKGVCCLDFIKGRQIPDSYQSNLEGKNDHYI